MNMKVSSHIVDSQEILDSILPLAFFLSLNLGSLFEIFLDFKKINKAGKHFGCCLASQNS